MIVIWHFSFKERDRDTNQEIDVTVYDYFQKTYGEEWCVHPRLPVFVCGTARKPVFLPMICCDIRSVQKSTRKLTEKQTSRMIRYACLSAPDRKRRIEELSTKTQYANDEFANAFGLNIDPRMTNVPARVLPPPAILYGVSICINYHYKKSFIR